MAIVVVLFMNIWLRDIKTVGAFLTSCDRFVSQFYFVL